MIAQFRHEEALTARPVRETVFAAIRRNHLRVLVFPSGNLILLDPCAEKSFGHAILFRAGAHTVAAADALVRVDEHRPPMLRDIVVGRCLSAALYNVIPRCSGRGSEQNELARFDQKLASVALFHSRLTRFPVCGVDGKCRMAPRRNALWNRPAETPSAWRSLLRGSARITQRYPVW